MKNYLITGGCGFIGSNFIKYFLKKHNDCNLVNLDSLTYAGNLTNLKEVENHPNYIFIKGDIRDEKLLQNLFKEYNFDYVINFAAESHVDRSLQNPKLFYEVNALGTLNLLSIARTFWETKKGYRDGVKFLQVSTDEVYGSLGATGLFSETTPLDPRSPYSASKASADLIVKAYYDTFNLPINITRCSNNYGPYQFPEKLIPLVFNNARKGKNIPVYGDGQQVRDWLYVEDHCVAIDLVLHNAKSGEIYNIGGNNERTNLDLVKIIINYVNQKIDSKITESLITHVVDRKGHDRRYGINASKIKKDLGWFPATDFETGIIKCLNWYKDNQAWIDSIINAEYLEYYENTYNKRKFNGKI